MSAHRHRAKVVREGGFIGAVSTHENRAAHGNVTRTEECECGAWRHVNANGGHREVGPWHDDSGGEQ